MSQYSIKSTSRLTADVGDIVLSTDGNDTNALTRRILRIDLVDNVHDSSSAVKACVMHQKRHSRTASWQDVDSFSLATMKAGQEVRLQLDCDETLRLYSALRDLYVVTKDGRPQDDQTVAVVNPDEVIIAIGQEKRAVEQLLERGQERLWEAINELQPDVLAAIGRAKVHETRRKAFQEFEHQLNANEWTEGEWEKLFRKNKWIFGYGLAYRFLSEIQGQPHYGGTTLTGVGGQRGDFLMASQAQVKFTVLVDIKTPSSPLVTRIYRNKVYEVGRDLVGAVSQLQSNCRTWVIDGSRREDNAEDLAARQTSTYEPKGILVIGTTAQLDDKDKRATFELFRRNLHNPEIITYDELFERARFIVTAEEDEEATDSSSIELDDVGDAHEIDLEDLVNHEAMALVARTQNDDIPW